MFKITLALIAGAVLLYRKLLELWAASRRCFISMLLNVPVNEK